MRAKYQVVAIPTIFCIVLIVFIVYAVKVFSSKESFNYPPEKEYVYVDPRPQVEQPFLQKYDTLTTESLKAFVEDWRKWSEEREELATDSLINNICKAALGRYTYKAKLDSARFSIHPYCIVVRHSDKRFPKQDYLSSANTKPFEGDTTFVVPAAYNERPVLYLTPEVKKKLDSYLHWIYEYRDGQEYEEVHHDREEALRKYCPAILGSDIPGYYSYYTYPMITDVTFYKDGVVLSVIIDPLMGEDLFLPNNSTENAEVVSSWIV